MRSHKIPRVLADTPSYKSFPERAIASKTTQNVALNYIAWFSWGSGEVKIRLGSEKFLSFLARAFLTEHRIVLWMAIESLA